MEMEVVGRESREGRGRDTGDEKWRVCSKVGERRGRGWQCKGWGRK